MNFDDMRKRDGKYLLITLKTKKMIEVCCAIIVKDQKMLAVQRPQESSQPGLWEFPGGKIHPEESSEQCIIREIQEELKVNIQVLYQLIPVEFDYGTRQIRLIPFICEMVSGKIVLTEHLALHWFGPEEWETIDWLGADRELILKNVERLCHLIAGKKE
jgi:8-oxo-dGTP diphosphatase